MQLPEPWTRLSFVARLRSERLLRRQMAKGHMLDGKTVKAHARNVDSDDVLFALPDGQVALVHLTGQKETSPDWPHVTVFASFEEFAADQVQEAEAAANYAPNICEECGSNWSANEVGENCETCRGYALFRPCPICGGSCGAIWERAVLDSNDQREPVFLGSCRLNGGST